MISVQPQATVGTGNYSSEALLHPADRNTITGRGSFGSAVLASRGSTGPADKLPTSNIVAKMAFKYDKMTGKATKNLKNFAIAVVATLGGWLKALAMAVYALFEGVKTLYHKARAGEGDEDGHAEAASEAYEKFKAAGVSAGRGLVQGIPLVGMHAMHYIDRAMYKELDGTNA